MDATSHIEVEETAKGFGFSTQYEAVVRVDLTSQAPLTPVMDALAEKLTAWTRRRGRLGVRLRLAFRGIDGSPAGVEAELKAMLERHPDLKQRLASLQERSASFLDKGHKQIGTYSFEELSA